MIACPAKRENPHVADYYNIVFANSNTCGFHNGLLKLESKVKLIYVNSVVSGCRSPD